MERRERMERKERERMGDSLHWRALSSTLDEWNCVACCHIYLEFFLHSRS